MRGCVGRSLMAHTEQARAMSAASRGVQGGRRCRRSGEGKGSVTSGVITLPWWGGGDRGGRCSRCCRPSGESVQVGIYRMFGVFRHWLGGLGR